MNNVLNRNANYITVLIISKILSGEVKNVEGLPKDLSNDNLTYFNHAHILFVGIEQNFSIYKN